jgi:small subunit ribosomal protein S18
MDRSDDTNGAPPRSTEGAGDSRYGYGGDDEAGGERARRYSQISERNRCRFCREKVARVDYKDVLTLQKLCTSQGRIFSRKRSGNCAAHQRMVKNAIKQARYVGLMSYTA